MHPTLVRDDLRYWRLEPDPRLRPGVLCYCISLPAPKSSAKPPICEAELLLPDGYSEWVFSLSAEFERWTMEASAPRVSMRSSYIIGGRSHSVLTRALGDLTIVTVKLAPHVCRRLIATPLSDFRDSTVTLADLNQRSLLDLENALANARSISKIAGLLNRFFLERLSAFEPGDAQVTELQHRIHAEHGAIPIVRWVRAQNIDRRHFERRFCAWTGMTPKRYARILRFKRAYYRMMQGEGARGASGLHLENYYDQSHFHRDFKYFMGVAPSVKLNRTMQQGMDISEHLIEGEFGRRAEQY